MALKCLLYCFSRQVESLCHVYLHGMSGSQLKYDFLVINMIELYPPQCILPLNKVNMLFFPMAILLISSAFVFNIFTLLLHLLLLFPYFQGLTRVGKIDVMMYQFNHFQSVSLSVRKISSNLTYSTQFMNKTARNF